MPRPPTRRTDLHARPNSTPRVRFRRSLVARYSDGAQAHVVVSAGALTRRSRPIIDGPRRIRSLALNRDHTVFVVIDMTDPAGPAIATVPFPRPIPPGLRCEWLPSTAH